MMKANILIVDDQKGVRRLLEELFRQEGWKVRSAADGLEAIELVEEQLPDLILMDVKMSGMNGLEAAQEIMRSQPGIPIIMMTAYGEIEVVRQALDAGVKRCISKPFEIQALRDIVDVVMADVIS